LALLLGLERPGARLTYMLAIGVVLMLSWWLLDLAWLLLLPVTLLWLVLVALVFRTREVREAEGIDTTLVLLSGPVLAAPWLGILLLHATASPWLVLFVLMLVWLTDTAAYFAGRRFGRRKLAPRLSPGKTVEGVLGGLLATALWSLLLWPLATGFITWLWLALLCLLTAVISVVGDLVESWLKRRRRLKDAGSLLPGHGGMLDRLDSLVAAVPVFALGFLLWETLI
jgi:phosphatidate cytidylyltransferase